MLRFDFLLMYREKLHLQIIFYTFMTFIYFFQNINRSLYVKKTVALIFLRGFLKRGLSRLKICAIKKFETPRGSNKVLKIYIYVYLYLFIGIIVFFFICVALIELYVLVIKKQSKRINLNLNYQLFITVYFSLLYMQILFPFLFIGVDR